jgi:hypothetical protein
MFLGRNVGLGQVESITSSVTDVLPDAYSDTTTLTGLPVIWEMALAAIGGLVVWSITKRGGRAAGGAVKRARKRIGKAVAG